MRSKDVAPVIIGALGAVSKKFEQYIGQLEIQIKTEYLQKAALLRTARTLRQIEN